MTDTRPPIVGRRDERGSALLGVLLLLMMMSALAAALGVSGETETLISRNQRAGAQAQAAAEAGLNHAVELAVTYIFEWKTNGFGSPEAATDALLLGPDLVGGSVDTDADNMSLGARTGIDASEDIPLGTRLPVGSALNAEYEAFIMDDDDTAPDENGDPLDDLNKTLIIRATGYGPDNTTVTLEALISTVNLPAIVTNSDIDLSGNFIVDGAAGSVHTNEDLTGNGTTGTIEGTATASGEYDYDDDDIAGTGGAAQIPIPTIDAADYMVWADFILKADGTMVSVSDGSVCTWSAKNSCNDWDFNGTDGWILNTNNATNGTYYVEGTATISGSPGSAKSPVQLSVLAEGSISITGNPKMAPDTPELLFVTNGDLKILGNTDIIGDAVEVQGQMLAHEQIEIGGNATLFGQIIAEDAANDSNLVDGNAIYGNAHITYSGGLGTSFFTITGWRDVR